MMDTFVVIDVADDSELGRATFDGSHVKASGLAAEMIGGRVRGGGESESEAFGFYHDGWANGYVLTRPEHDKQPDDQAPRRDRGFDDFAARVARDRSGPDSSAEPDEPDWQVEALIAALAEYAGEADERAFDPSLHKRWPRGHPLGGKFRPMVDLVLAAISEWQDGGRQGDPFELFNRAQLVRAAKARGIDVANGEDRDSIAEKLLTDIGAAPAAATPAATTPPAAAPGGAAPVSVEAAKETVEAMVAQAGVTMPSNPPAPAAPRPSRAPRPTAAQAAPRRASTSLRISEALTTWASGRGPAAPLAGFDREPLRRVARDYGIQLRRGASTDDIAQALLDYTRRNVRDPAQGAALPSLAGMLTSRSGGAWSQNRTDMARDVRAVFDGEFAGLRTRVNSYDAYGRDNSRQMYVEGTIYDAENRPVGRFSQDYRADRDGKLVAHHGLMTLEPHVQGGGFASTYGLHLLNYYRENGVKELHTLANIDVGGYTWAKSGFDFANLQAARNVMDRLDRTLAQLQWSRSGLRGAPNIDEQIQAAEHLLQRARNARDLRHPDFPTAFEVSQLGRWDGAGKDDMWIGKQALLGSTWEAVLRL